LRYDKRGIGETGNAMRLAAEKAKIVIREEDLSFETLIADAVSWGKQLSADRRFSSLIVLGHSEGSLIGMIAAEKIGAQAYVLCRYGSSRTADSHRATQAQLTPDLVKASEEILQQLVAGKRVESVPSQLNLLFRPSVQPYLISWFHYDPVKEIARLKIQCSWFRALTDIQVSLLEAKLLAGANPGATLVPIEGMNHVLKTVPSDRTQQVSSYSDPTLPIAPMLIAEISRFIGAKRP
jgi:pimeloyl-ACP methyl ester carboxylesterase